MQKITAQCPGVFYITTRECKSCLVIERTGSETTYIPLGKPAVLSAPNAIFDEEWQYAPDYSVKQFCNLVLGASQRLFSNASRQAMEHLRRFAESSAAPKSFLATQSERKLNMAKAPATEMKNAKIGKPVAGKEPAAKADKKAAAPAKKATKAEPEPAPAKKATGKAADGVDPKSKKNAQEFWDNVAGKAKAEGTGKAAAKKSPAEEAKAPAKRTSGDVKHVVADDSSVKRGFLREYVDEAKKMKTFTRDALNAKFAGKEEPERLVRYFNYCVSPSLGIFAAA